MSTKKEQQARPRDRQVVISDADLLTRIEQERERRQHASLSRTVQTLLIERLAVMDSAG